MCSLRQQPQQSPTGSTSKHDGWAISNKSTGPIAEDICSMSESFMAKFHAIHVVVDSLNSSMATVEGQTGQATGPSPKLSQPRSNRSWADWDPNETFHDDGELLLKLDLSQAVNHVCMMSSYWWVWLPLQVCLVIKHPILCYWPYYKHPCQLTRFYSILNQRVR